jgi:hypothetical protein
VTTDGDLLFAAEVDGSPDTPKCGLVAEGIGSILPLVRTFKTRWEVREFLRIDRETITLVWSNEPLREEFITNGMAAYLGCGCCVVIPISSILRIRRIRSGHLSEWSLCTQFVIETRRGAEYRFGVSNREIHNVLLVLRELLGTRLEQEERRASRVEWLLVGLGVACVPLFLFGGDGGKACSILLAVCVLLALFVMASTRLQSENRSSPAPLRRGGEAGKKPFHSLALGWLLKVAGLAWVIFWLFSETADQLGIWTNIQWLLPLPGLFPLYLGYRLCQRPFDPFRHPDPRPPILFLRAFDDDDQKSLQPTTTLARLHGIEQSISVSGDRWWRLRLHIPFWALNPIKLVRWFLNQDCYSLEESLAAGFWKYGPLIAIGRPGERTPTPGAERMYVADDRWQEVVLGHLRRCTAVIIQPSKSPGIRWEIEQVFARVPIDKILLSMINFQFRPNDYELFCEWVEQLVPVRLPRIVPFIQEPCFVYFEPDGTARIQRVCYRSPLLWFFLGNAIDLSRTFRSFLQGLWCEKRGRPETPHSYPVAGTVSGLIMGTIVFVPIVLVLAAQIMHQLSHDSRNDYRTNREEYRAYPTHLPQLMPTTYRGQKFGYEITLGPEWETATIPANLFTTDRMFKHPRGGLVVAELYDKQFGIGKDFPGELAEIMKKTLTANYGPGIKVTLVSDRAVVDANGNNWRELVYDRSNRTNGGLLDDRQWIRIHNGLGETLSVFVFLPRQDMSQSDVDAIFRTLKLSDPKK